MASNRNNSNTTGLTCLGLLQVSFIILKILKLINWSWLLVLVPTWGPILLCIIIIIFITKLH